MRLEVVIRRGLNPPHKHGPNFSHHSMQRASRENSKVSGLPSDVAAGRQEAVRELQTAIRNEIGKTHSDDIRYVSSAKGKLVKMLQS